MTTIPGIIDILTYCRPHGGQTVEEFCNRFLDNIPGMEIDGIGNRQLLVGSDQPRTLWSAHVDTMHAKDGRQTLHWGANNIISLSKKSSKPGSCLGADNGAGVWMLLNLIEAGVPGLYLFHQGEERGGIGSSYIAKNRSGILKGIQRAIAFDRKGTDDLIYEMGVGETASIEFAEAFCALLNDTPQKLYYKPCNLGSFTDTANYGDDIPECCNVSVGYYREHGPLETLDYGHLRKLRDTMLLIAPRLDELPAKRTPGEYGWAKSIYSENWWKGYKRSGSLLPYYGLPPGPNVIGSNQDKSWSLSELTALVREYPDMTAQMCEEIARTDPKLIAELLLEYGISTDDFIEEIALYQ